MDAVLYLGCDPGKTGAVVGLTDDGQPRIHIDMPTDDSLLAEVFNVVVPSLADRAYVAVEKVWSNPIWGKRHCFEFGRQKGRLEQAITSAGLEFFRVTPTGWQKHFGLSKTPEERNGYKGQRIWKKRIQQHAIGLFDGRVTLPQADAYLIAEWCRNQVQEGILK